MYICLYVQKVCHTNEQKQKHKDVHVARSSYACDILCIAREHLKKQSLISITSELFVFC